MSSAIMTLIGLYNYDHTLFDGFDNLPAGIDKELLVDTVIMRGGEYEVLYPNPDLLKSLISSWSTRYYPVISNWLKAQGDIAEVNPLENYDRYESWEDRESGQHSDTSTSTSQNASTSSSTDTMRGSGNTSGTDNTSGNASTSGTDTVSAFDSNTLVNDKGTSQTNTTQTASATETTSQTATTSEANTTGSSSGNVNETSSGTNSKAGVHEGHIHGNIGVTTAGAMYREFLDVIGKYGNIYESVATIFLQSFVIPLV